MGNVMILPLDIAAAEPDVLGETLRGLTFTFHHKELPGDASHRIRVGCVDTFEVRDDAVCWLPPRKARFIENWFAEPDDLAGVEVHGFTYALNNDDLLVDVFWFFEGRTGDLTFVVRQGSTILRAVTNDNCAQTYGWEDLDEE